MTQIKRCAFLFFALSMPLACGGEDDDKGSGGGSTTVESGLDGSKPVNTLTQDEVNQLGKSYSDSVNSGELIDGICTFMGVFTSSLGALGGGGGANAPSCEDVANDCKQTAKSNPQQAASQANALPTQTAGFAACDITVAELEACLTASLKMMSTVFGSLSCDQDPMAMPMIDTTAFSTASLMECQNLNTKCPTLITPPASDAGDEEL